MVLVGLVLLVVERPAPAPAVIFACIGVAVAWWISPLRRGRGLSHAAASRRAEAGAVVVYWRPGCPYCARLRLALGRARTQALWVNIWADADAAAFVRSTNAGNETVPTVVVGTEAPWTNPAPAAVRDALYARC